MPLSTTYRYLAALTAAGFVEESAGVFGPGPRLGAPNHPAGLETLARLGRPLLRSLVDVTGETALVTVRVGAAGLILERVESPHFVRLSFEEGSMRPLHAGASVKVLLAYAPPEVLNQVVGAGMQAFTARTPGEAALRAQLREVRARGYAVSHGEVDEHAVAVGVPIFLGRQCVAGLSLAGPEQRFGPDRIEGHRQLVQAAGRSLSEALTRLDRLPTAQGNCQ
jgi:IclR family transcriptional regulator, acetate operon repressor